MVDELDELMASGWGRPLSDPLPDIPEDDDSAKTVKELLRVLQGIRERAAVFATGDAHRPKKTATGACAWIKGECDGVLAKYGAPPSD